MVLGNQSQVDIQCARTVGQRQLMVAAANAQFAVIGHPAIVYVFYQVIAVQRIQVQAGEVRSKDSQQLFVLSGVQAVMQPQRLVWRCGIKLV
ncbi:hypothetical protein D3C77_729510 [compost metagenome]